MKRPLRVCVAVAFAVFVAVADAGAQDSVLGTFTVGGKTVKFTNIYATMETSPVEASQKYLILLVTDVPVAPADRSPARLASLASSGTLHAVRLLWSTGSTTSPSCPTIPASRKAGAHLRRCPR